MGLRNTLRFAATHAAAKAALAAETAPQDEKPELTQKADEKAARAVSLGATPQDITDKANLLRHLNTGDTDGSHP